MIKPVKGLSPIFVNYYDNGEASIYNLTQSQHDRLWEELEDATEAIKPFEIEQPLHNIGYVPEVVSTLALIYGFEVDSE